ncbi:Uncharacterised protein [Nocardia otitidiscaviarum]|uniref:Uncharacterized protein n=1 Tax=Nocardia otitidiscaviarum TaxID=1823 RepID=A0A379JKS3_9NOCA|nr:hypothetical protein [Nocardia otitidiscaviarum]SUD49202.1 Uncharacterised protein [Nocardia otitidiscaviarum]
MSAGVVAYLLACVVALATIALRLTVWRTRHGSRPFTIALSLLLPGIVLRHPLLLERDWLPQDSFAGTYLTNFTDLVGDLLIVAAGAYLFTVVARAWGREDLRPWIVRVFTAGGMVMVVLWAVSDAPRTQTKYVGYLAGRRRCTRMWRPVWCWWRIWRYCCRWWRRAYRAVCGCR